MLFAHTLRQRSRATLLLALGCLVLVPTAASAATLTIPTTADTYADETAPSTAHGSSVELVGDGATDLDRVPYLKFQVPTVTGTIVGAKLRINVLRGTAVLPEIRTVATSSWTEAGLTWNNHPALGTAVIATASAANPGWAEFDVSSAVTASGTITLAIRAGSTDGAAYASREAGAASAPQLVLTIADTLPPSAPPTLTATGAGTGSVKLAWGAAADDTAVTSYQVLQGSTVVATLPASTLTATRTGLTEGASIGFSVRALDAAGNVGAAKAVTAVVPSAPVVTPPPAPTPAPTTGGFVHPGVVNSRAQLDLVKAKIAAGAQPWSSALTAVKNSKYGKSTWAPQAAATVSCGAGGNPACLAQTDDAIAAYSNALIWYYTGATANRDAAIRILNAQSATLKSIPFDTGANSNGLLQSGWAGEMFTKAAEVMRYSSSGWAAADITRFEKMLTTIFLPNVRNGWKGGAANWQMSMADATMSIGVFTNDRAVYNDGLSDWRKQMVASIYLKTDGATPVPPAETIYDLASEMQSYWRNPLTFANGLEQETCRDMGHMAFGMAAIVYGAETGTIQGVDLYKEQQARIVAGFEFNNRFINNPAASGWPCSSPMDLGGAAYKNIGELAYTRYTQRGVAMPETRKLVSGSRPQAAALHFAWETLTHGSVL